MMIMGGALVVAIIVAMLVQMKMAPKTKTNNDMAPATEVLVAKADLVTGDVLKADDVEWKSVPDTAIFKGMIKKKDVPEGGKPEAYGKPLRRDITAGEPITMQALITESAGGGFLSAQLSPGMRAVGVSVRAETTAGGFVAPGDYVDVIMTYQVNLKGDAVNYSDTAVQRFASETILSNIKVLAVDQNAKESSREAKVSRTVTLEVSKEGAQVLAMATTMGQISLALRRLGEKDTAADKNTPITTDVTTSRVIQEVYQIMDKSKMKSDTVRVYNGSAVSNVPVRSLEGR